jgi:hypothetical protein
MVLHFHEKNHSLINVAWWFLVRRRCQDVVVLLSFH